MAAACCTLHKLDKLLTSIGVSTTQSPLGEPALAASAVNIGQLTMGEKNRSRRSVIWLR